MPARKRPHDRNAWIKSSSWYGKAVANDRAAEARGFQRAPRARSSEADAQVRLYAEWLLRRDGVDLDALRAAAVAAVPADITKVRGREWDRNDSLREQIAKARPTVRVEWQSTEHGYRPRFVRYFEFRGSFPHTLVHTVELPNWSAAWEHVETLDEALAA